MLGNSNLSWWVLRLSIAALLAWGSVSLARADLFASDEPLSVRLEAPFARITRTRTEPEYQAGRLVYADTSGTEVAIDLRVRVRGKSRARICAFPPLLLNFPAGALAGTVFEGENRLKLVTHCESGPAYEAYLLIEYLAYRVLNLVTDTSLRVRLVEATYNDSERGRAVVTKPAFLIEDEENFAARRRLDVVAEERIDRTRYDGAALNLIEMFQFFIGNTDWSPLSGPVGEPCCHNVVPLARDDGSVLPIPYDFDTSGIVNAPYALPAEALPIRKVRQRLYRGVCRDLAELEASFEPFQRSRAAITALFDRQPRLGKFGDSARGYVDEFYELLADPERVQRAFRSECAR